MEGKVSSKGSDKPTPSVRAKLLSFGEESPEQKELLIGSKAHSEISPN